MSRAHLVASSLLALVACDTVGIKRSYMALDATGNRKRDRFQTDTENIYCVAEMASGVDDVTVVAKLRAKTLFDPFSGRPVQLAREAVIGAEEQSPGRGENLVVSFLLLKPEGDEFYPAGEFSCEIYVDGKLEKKLPFEIGYPTCPFKPIEAMHNCEGQVLFNSQCPSPLGRLCICNEETAVWDCE